MILARDFLVDCQVHRSPAAPSAPLVTVILPTHCRRDLLRRSLTTVRSQSFADWELLVMDDGSRDGSCELIEEFRAQDPRIVHVRHERNSGLPGLRVNEGIEMARGRYLAFQFDDDCWRPNALEALVSQASRNTEPAVVVGHSHFVAHNGKWDMPNVELNYVNLCQENRFANNSVLVPRELVERYGMYDCHIGMRRLCDWDLWLRYSRHVPFVLVPDVISDVFEYNPGSIALTVPWDMALFRYFNSIPRDALLVPDRWRDYPVDSLKVGEVEFDKDYRRRLYEEHIVPYYLRFRHYFPAVEGFPGTLPDKPKTVLLTKYSYDVTNDITLNHYDAPTHQRGSYKAHFQVLPQVDRKWISEADALLLVRTVEDEAKALAKQALASDKPVGLYLDDDMLHFYEFGPQFDYIAPGTPYHKNLTYLLGQVDAVWATTRSIVETVQPLNPRTIPHNNAIPAEWLPATIRHREPGKPLRIGYVGTAYRRDEFEAIWSALQRLSQEQGENLRFEFWGLDVDQFPPLASPVVCRPFTFSYFNYLGRLKEAEFDILLAPLLDHPRPRLAKSLIKYYETAVAGALGIFSDGPQYQQLPDGLTCLKAENTAEAWYGAINRAIRMPPCEFDLMRQRLLEHVREEFTESAQIHLHEAAWRATEFHAHTRKARHADGRPRVVYVIHSMHFGGGELQLWRRFHLAREYGIEPIVVFHSLLQDTEQGQRVQDLLEREQIQVEFVEFTFFETPKSPADFFSDRERTQIRQLLERCNPALVHTVTFMPSFGQVCDELGIPHVATLYQVDDAFAWVGPQPHFHHAAVVQSDTLRYAERWNKLLDTEKFCSRTPVPLELFNLGQERYLQCLGKPASATSRRVRLASAGTIQERKRQLELIQAVGELCRQGWDCQLDLYGYTHFYPEYLAKCEQAVREYGLEDRVTFRGFTDDVTGILKNADVLISSSGAESFPGIVAEAMAAGTLVATTPVGGVSELLVDGVTGILCADTSKEAMMDALRRCLQLNPTDRTRIVEQARRVARSEFHPYRTANDLFDIYNRALESGGARTGAVGKGASARQVPWVYRSRHLGPLYLKVSRGAAQIRIGLAPPKSRRRAMLSVTNRGWRYMQRAGAVGLMRRVGQKIAYRLGLRPTM